VWSDGKLISFDIRALPHCRSLSSSWRDLKIRIGARRILLDFPAKVLQLLNARRSKLRRDLSFDFAADSAQVKESRVARLDATLRISTSALQRLSTARPHGAPFDAVDSAEEHPRHSRAGRMESAGNIMDGVKCVARSFSRSRHCWPTCLLEQTGPIDLALTHGNDRRSFLAARLALPPCPSALSSLLLSQSDFETMS